MKPSGIVYLIGISIPVLFYYEIKEFIGGGVWFIVAAVIYFICLKFLADLITGKKKKCK